LPIASSERQLFEAIDGIRSIADIVIRALPSSHRSTNLNLARTFFKRLWWHDQVVFDASQQQTGV
jgi:hypothetical protein